MSTEPGARSFRTGAWYFVLGFVALTVLSILGVLLVDERFLQLVSVTTSVTFIGIGHLIRPWSPEMCAANSEPNARFGKFWRAMPLFWKVWFVGSLVVGVAVMVAVLLLL